MAKLNDTQLILLSTASQRDGRNLYPLSETLADAADRAAKAIVTLIKRGLVEERETSDQTQVHRTDGDIRYGVYATDAGLGVVDGEEAPSPASAAAVASPRVTKSSVVLDLLERDGGATLAELIAATDWLPHTTRAALTGLRKKGHVVERTKRGEETRYRIAKAA